MRKLAMRPRKHVVVALCPPENRSWANAESVGDGHGRISDPYRAGVDRQGLLGRSGSCERFQSYHLEPLVGLIRPGIN
jgi:hypothetical protein